MSRASGNLPDGSDVREETDTEHLLPIARFCLVNASVQSTDGSDTAHGQIDADSSPNGEFEFGHGSSPDRRVFGPLPSAVGLQFTSNLNLLNMHPAVVPGKGILLEYIGIYFVLFKSSERWYRDNGFSDSEK